MLCHLFWIESCMSWDVFRKRKFGDHHVPSTWLHSTWYLIRQHIISKMASPIPPTPKSFESTSVAKKHAWALETSKTEPQIFPIRARITPRGGEVDQKITAGAKNVAHFILGAVLVASWARLRGQDSSKLASQIEGKSIKNPCKIDQKLDAFQVPFFSNFVRCLEGKWRHVGTKIGSRIDANFERPILKKYWKTNYFQWFSSYWGRSWHRKSIKINQNLKLEMDCLLASILVDFGRFWIDFGSLFWLIFESQLVRKGNQNDERCQGQKPLPKKRPGRRVHLRTPLPPPGPPPPPPPPPGGRQGFFDFWVPWGRVREGETEVVLTRHMTPEGSADLTP